MVEFVINGAVEYWLRGLLLYVGSYSHARVRVPSRLRQLGFTRDEALRLFADRRWSRD